MKFVVSFDGTLKELAGAMQSLPEDAMIKAEIRFSDEGLKDGGAVTAPTDDLEKNVAAADDLEQIRKKFQSMFFLTIDDKTLKEAIRWLSFDQKINAIKAVRSGTGIGLKEGKDFVDCISQYWPHVAVIQNG